MHSTQKHLSLGLLFTLLAGCEQPKQAAEKHEPPVVTETAPRPAPAKEKILTSGDTWPSTSHDTLKAKAGVVRFLPVSKADFNRLPAPRLASHADTVDSPTVMQSFGEVRREGIRLLFTAANGREVVMAHDTSDSETTAYYHFWGPLPKAHQWVVSITLYEGSAMELVDQRTGRRTTLWGTPVASPDGRYIVAHSADLAAAFDENGLQLYRVEKSGPRLVWQRSINSWEPLEVRWADNSSIVVKQGSGPTDDGGPKGGYVRLDLSEVL